MMFLRRGHQDTSTGQFDRDVFDEKMKTFDALVHGSDDISGEIQVAPTTNDDDILSLDDSVVESPVSAKKPSPHSTGNKGALEQTLMISPVKRSKKPLKSPVSSSSRKGLARFLRVQNLDTENSRSERNLGDLEAIWQCSDIMSVAASVPAELDIDDHQTVKSLATFDPSFSKHGHGAGMLRRASKTTFVAKDEDALHRSASVRGYLDASDKERKRSKSLEPATPSSNQTKNDGFSLVGDNATAQKTPRRKLKNNVIDPLSQSDHVMSMLSPVPCLTPPGRDTKSNRVLVRSKASTDNPLPMIPSTSPSMHGKIINISPKDHSKEKSKKKKTNPKVKTKGNVDDGPDKKEVVIIMSPEVDPSGQKKKRSKSLTRLNLYDHESVDKTKRDPSKRRGGKKERRPSLPGDDTLEPSVTRRSAGSVSCAGESPRPRLSRRQLMKRMDSESVISAPARAGSDGRSASPRPGRMTSSLPRRRDSERGALGTSLHRQGSTRGLDRSRHDMGQEQEQSIQPVSPSVLPRRGDSQRNLGSNALNGPSSATTLRRKLSASTMTKSGTEDRSELLKRIDSVNSFFGKGKGEVGSAYPSNTERNERNLQLVQEGSRPSRPPQSDKSDKERPRRSYRNLSVT